MRFMEHASARRREQKKEDPMKSRHLSATLALYLGALLTASALFADDHHPCTYKAAAGDYGYTATGTITGIGLVAAVGSYILDRDGNVLNGKETFSFNGLIVEETFTGTYVINSDCTGTAVLDVVSPVENRTAHLSTIAVNDHNLVHQIGTDPGTILTVESNRLLPH
jgi:hypothetical protein